MISSLARSIAFASLFASPATAFTTTLNGAASSGYRPAASSSNTALYNSAAEDHSSNSPQRPSLASSSSQEQQLNNNNDNLDLPQSPYSPSSGFDDDSSSHTANQPRSSEFGSLEPLLTSPTRRSRLEIERRSEAIYTSSGSDDYWALRDEIVRLEQDLQSALDAGVSDTALDAIQGMLRRAQTKDPEHVYMVTSGAARSAERMGHDDVSQKYWEESLRARKMMPQFNLEGLWVGK